MASKIIKQIRINKTSIFSNQILRVSKKLNLLNKLILKNKNHKFQLMLKFIIFKQMFSRWPRSIKCCQKDLNLISWNKFKNKQSFIKRKRRDLQIIW